MKNRRSLLLIISLFSFTLLFAKGGTQQGIAYLYDYKTKTKRPIAEVKLTVAGAKPTTSRADGTFTLVFDSYGMGDKIANSKDPYCHGLKVFNKKEVDNWYIVKGRIRLIMCKYEEFELVKNTYYQLGMKAATEKYEKQIRQIKANHKLKEAEMRQQLQEAEENYLRAMEMMSESSEEMARIDQSELDATMREILDLFEHGNVEEAMTKLKSLQLADEFDKRTAKIDEKQKEIEELDSDLLVIIEQMRVAIPALKNQGEWEEVGKYLKRIAEKTKTPEDISEYAYFCAQQHNYMEGVAYYEKALEIYRRLSAVNPSAYEPDVAGTLNNLANLYQNTQRYSDAEEMYKEALEIRRRLSAVNPSAYEPDVAMTLNNLANLYNNTQRYSDAEEMYKEAQEIYRRLSAVNPAAYEPDVASTLNNLAILYTDTQRYSDAELLFKEALEIYRRLSAANPSVYEPYVAKSLIGRAFCNIFTQHFNEAQSLLQEARPLVEKYPFIGIDLQTIDEILESIK